jgi:tetratricopeptide (TPR) repeat protein
MRRAVVAACWAIALLALPRVVSGGAGDLEEAASLREQSGVDWNAGRYREAADKLQRAARIYERAPEKFVADLATVRRAIVWNLTKAGDLPAAREPFEALLRVYARDDSVRSDAWSAYQALYEAAKAASDLAAAQVVLDGARESAQSVGAKDIGSQVLHDLGSIARDHGERDRARSYFEAAIGERRSSGDRLGEAWSLNNLANLDIIADAWRSALAPLLAAQRIVVADRLPAPMLAVATNVRTTLEKIAGEGGADATTAKWVRDLADLTLASDVPLVVPTDFLLRSALAAALRASSEAPARLAAARSTREAASKLVHMPPETRADLVLVAAQAAIENGGEKDAAAWLKDVDVGSGPSAAHLAARLAVARARCAKAAGTRAADLKTTIDGARKALATLGDRPLVLASLPLLADAAKANGLAALASEITSEAERARRDGEPGGRASSARGGGDRVRYRSLGLLDAVFEVTWSDGKLAIRDLLTDAEPLRVAVVWQPQNLAIDGLSLTAFGGYVVVRKLDYGGASVTSGSPGSIALAELGAYLPVPAKGALVVHANSAVSYRK